MKKLFTILVMLVALNASAQWEQAGNVGTFSDFTSYNNNLYVSAFILTADNDNPLYGPGVYYSTNNGTNWIQTAFPYSATEIHFKGTRLFAYSNSEHKSYYSDNFGTNWTITNSYLNASYNSNNTHLFVSTSNGLLVSTNDGLNWSTTHTSTRPAFVKDNYVYLYGSDIYVSSNNGANWTTVNYSVSCMATNGAVIYAGNSSGGVLKSTDNGYTFVPTTSIGSNVIYSIVAVGSNIIAATNTSSGIFVSTNNGTTWTQKNEGFTGTISINKLIYLNGYIFAGLTNTVWRRLLSNLVGVQTISTEVPSAYSLSQNYPNPFNPMTNVKFSIVKAGDVKVVVYDIMGREVQTLVNERLNAGMYEARFDGSSLNSGVYFYKMVVRHGGSSTGDFTETKRMILIK
jgi:hypothetical protein